MEEEIRALLMEEFDAEGVVLADSGTTALTLALSIALRAQRGSRIAAPAYTCFSVATAIAGARGDAFLYDLEPETLSPSPASIELALRNGIQVLLACPLYGYPVDVPALLEQGKRHGALVVEDAAQGAWGTLRGRTVGSFAPLAILSFGRGKGLTCGGGGALLVRDPGLLHLARAAEKRLLPPHSGRKELFSVLGEWALGRPSLYRIPASLPFLKLGETRYETPAPGRRIAGGTAFLLVELLRGREGPLRAEERRRRAGLLRKALAGVDGVEEIRPLPEAVPGALRLPFLLPGPSRGGAPELGAMPGYPSALHEISAFRPHVGWTAPALGGTRHLVRSLVTAPTHAWTPSDLGRRLSEWAEREAGLEGRDRITGGLSSVHRETSP